MADNKVHMNAQIPALHNQQALEALEFHSVFTVYNGGGVRGSRPGWRKKLRGSSQPSELLLPQTWHIQRAEETLANQNLLS